MDDGALQFEPLESDDDLARRLQIVDHGADTAAIDQERARRPPEEANTVPKTSLYQESMSRQIDVFGHRWKFASSHTCFHSGSKRSLT
jgi:hypothetical protein